MAEDILRGIVPMQVTPFRAGGELDLDSLARTVEWQAGLPRLGALSALGIAGEFFKLATDEAESVIATVAGASGRLSTLVGVTGASAHVAARLARHAARSGADVLLALPPYGIKPSADELIEYYAAIARAADLPIMVQDGSDELRAVVPYDTLVRLCRAVSAIRYIKVEDVAPGPKITRLGETLGADVVLLCGSGGLQMLDCYDRGAIGCISGAATADIFAVLDGAYRTDRDAADRYYRAVLPLVELQCQSSELFVAAEKAILHARGLIDSPTVRAPGYALDDRQRSLVGALYREAAAGTGGAAT